MKKKWYEKEIYVASWGNKYRSMIPPPAYEMVNNTSHTLLHTLVIEFFLNMFFE